MLIFILNIVGPVFLLMLAGFLSVRTKVLTSAAVDGLMRFATHVALPCLLFSATSSIDLSTAYNWRMLVSYFGVAIACFAIAYLTTRKWFSRRPGEAVAVSFGNLFSNLVLLGTPIIDRAFGDDALVFVFALISVNAPTCYLVGITVMESVRADGRSLPDTAKVIGATMFKNSLMIGIMLGFVFNFTGLSLPALLSDTIDMFKAAALPCALFALGGVLTRYSLSKELTEAGWLSMISLLLQPLITYAVCTALGVDDLVRNVVVILAAMPAGLNGFLFASMYSRGIGTAANTVLLATMVSVVSVSAWLWILI